MATTAAVRGCGSRVAGGVYLCTPLGPRGHEVECYLLDPPRPIEASVMGLSPIGVHLFTDKHGTTHVLDWIGADSYPNVADFIEETRRLGISRRISKGAEFARLTTQSRLYCCHARGLIANPRAYYAGIERQATGQHHCPAFVAYEHCERGQSQPHMAVLSDDCVPCGRLWWHDIDGGRPIDPDGVLVERTVGSTTYTARARPRGIGAEYDLAIFAALPIARIEVVQDLEGQTHDEALDKANRSSLPVILTEE